ncbi:MAG: ACP S-malonyltransferase [Bacteroidales bacterium]|nr:ACP S-malonyltransferase [Bacteroidales bacterium]MBR5056571.1 ACP S-malonyltransferase [Bacteroidales bacterium]
MKAYVFPGQGSQFPGMGKELYESNAYAMRLFDKADEILGFKITEIMFGEEAEPLKATNVTQPAVFLHSVITALCGGLPRPDAVAGHSLGEFSALVASGALDFEAALRLVAVRARAMQKCCETVPGTMAAVLACPQEVIEKACDEIQGVVVAANYNCEGQIVISGEIEAVNAACALLKERGAKRAVQLQVGGAFHSPLMEPARQELAEAIEATPFSEPFCPIYQNVDALPHTDPEEIKANLLMQLTSPVRWTQTVRNMVADGFDSFLEIGPGTVLQGLVKKTAPDVTAEGLS